MAQAAVDVLGYLPSPALKTNSSACHLLEGQILAYAVSNATIIVDVRSMQLATVLLGVHRAPVTAVSWSPEHQGRDLTQSNHLRLAAGDAEGRVVVWDVHTGAAVSCLDDPWQAATEKRVEGGKGTGVRALAWVLSSPCLLAVALSGLCIVWDTRGAGGGIVWKKDLALDMVVTSIQVDPTDCRRFCLCVERGTLMVFRLLDLARDKSEQQTYRVDVTASKAAKTLRCAFSASPDLLYVLLPREIVVFDLEYGQPASSSTLGASRPAFKDLLGCFGHTAVGKDNNQPGIDLLLCSHQDGSISAWRRKPEQLTYTLVGIHEMVPPPSRINNNHTLSLVCCCAAPWRRAVAEPLRSILLPEAQYRTASFTTCFDADTASNRTTDEGSKPSVASEEGPLIDSTGGTSGPSDLARSAAELKQSATGSGFHPISLLVVCVSDDGQIWQWDVPLESPQLKSQFAHPHPKQSAETHAMGVSTTYIPRSVALSVGSSIPTHSHTATNSSHAAAKPELLGLLHTLPHSVTTFSACPAPVSVAPDLLTGHRHEQAVGVLAAVTAGGNVELVTLQQGLLMPLHPHVSVSLGAHRDLVRGVRWLGLSSRLASFSSEKTAGGFRNSLLLTDVCNRASIAIRDIASEAAPMLGIRSSPSGRYLLVLLRGAPSEIWLVGGSGRPSRIRVLDLPFTAVEWVIPNDAPLPNEPMAAPKRTLWQRSPLSRERSLSGYMWEESGGSGEAMEGDAEGHPEERLAFGLADGRVGVLSVKGRKVTDTKPKRPVWGMLGGSPDSIPTAVAAWGHLVILGNDDGLLSRWDTRTGRTTSIATNQGTIRKLHFAAPASLELREGSSHSGLQVNARIAVLCSSGSFGVWELDSQNELKATALAPGSTTQIGKVNDLSWAPLPAPVGPGSVLSLATEDGSLAFVDAVQTMEQGSQRRRLATMRGLLTGALSDKRQIYLPAPLAHGSSLLMTRSWSLLLSILLQSGVPPRQLRSFCRHTAESNSAAEDTLWACLPKGIREAWKRHPVSSAEIQAVPMLAADHDLRTVIRRRTGSITASSSAADLSKHGSSGLSVMDVRGGTEQNATTSQANKETYRESVVQRFGDSSSSSGLELGDTQVLQSAPTGTALGSLKARMSKMAKAGAQAMRDSIQRPGDSLDSKTGNQGAAHLAQDRVSADAKPHEPAPLSVVLGALSDMRANGDLLHPSEWAAYEAAVASESCAARMAVAAEVSGSHEEASFWRALPSTLATLRSSLPASFTQPAANLVLYTDPQTGISAYRRRSMEKAEEEVEEGEPNAQCSALTTDMDSARSPSVTPETRHIQGELWSEKAQLEEARERAAWHERMARSNIEQSEALQERRVLEYIALGDYQTAVGFLLASTPDRSARYYRDALCTMALAAASTEAYQPSTPGVPEPVSRTLHIQVAKVVTAHAASVGDTLIGVPLLCSAGLPMEAVTVLQDASLWRYGATLAAHALRRDEQAATLERWASHIHQAEGSLWRALGVLTAAGALRNAVLLLRKKGLPDCAAAYIEAAVSAGFGSQSVASDAGGLENWHHTGSTALRQRSLSSTQSTLADMSDSGSVGSDFEKFCRDLLWHL